MADYAAIVKVIQGITAINSAPCKKTLQKIVYLIEAKNVSLGCEFGIHFFGPYSSDLDFAVRQLNDEGIVNIQYTPMEHIISVIDDTMAMEYNNPIVDETIKEFASISPSDLELIATALYVYIQTKDRSSIKPGVKRIKGSKYTDSKINWAIKKLDDTGYFAA